MKELTIARGVLVCMATAFLAMGSAKAQETDAPPTSEEVPTTTEEVPVTDSTTETGADSVPTGKIAAEFQDFLGADAESVVRGLRNGESFTLTESTPGETTPGETPDQPGPTSEVTIEPATGKMGYGNVRTALQLSQFQLQQAGIDQPTASQLDASLNGGSVTNSEGTTTEFQGVLALRSEGMGWGRIAQEYGTKVDWVKNGRASLTAPASEGTGGEAGDAGGEGLAPSGDTTSGDPVTVTGLTDSVDGGPDVPLDGAAGSSCDLTNLVLQPAPGIDSFYLCSFSQTLGANTPGTQVRNVVTASGVDDDGVAVSASDDAVVTYLDSPVTGAELTVIKNAAPSEVVEPGGPVTYTVAIQNTSTSGDPVTVTGLTDSVDGGHDRRGMRHPQVLLAPGQTAIVRSQGHDSLGSRIRIHEDQAIVHEW